MPRVQALLAASKARNVFEVGKTVLSEVIEDSRRCFSLQVLPESVLTGSDDQVREPFFRCTILKEAHSFDIGKAVFRQHVSAVHGLVFQIEQRPVAVGVV